MMNSWFFFFFLIIALLTLVSLKYPLINDITTDFKDPPPIPKNGDYSSGVGNLHRYPNEFASVQANFYSEVRPMKVRLSGEAALELIDRLAKETPRLRVISQHPSRPIVLLEASSRLFRFKDDVAIRIEEKASHTLVQFRSRSRIGLGDFGANARRIVKLQQKLEELVNKIGPRREPPLIAEN